MKQLLRGTHHPECPRQRGSTQCYCSALYVRDRMDQHILSLYTDETQSGRTDTMRETVTTVYDLQGLHKGAEMGNGQKIIDGLKEAIAHAKECKFENIAQGTAMNIEDTLAERAASYGDYAAKAVTVQALKDLIRCTPNWNDMAPAFQESMDMICSKMGRLLHGDPEHVDSWHDIEGYARLARRMVE